MKITITIHSYPPIDLTDHVIESNIIFNDLKLVPITGKLVKRLDKEKYPEEYYFDKTEIQKTVAYNYLLRICTLLLKFRMINLSDNQKIIKCFETAQRFYLLSKFNV